MRWGKTRKGKWIQGYYYVEDGIEYIITQHKCIHTGLVEKIFNVVVEIK